MSQFQAIIFDVDGTLLDTREFIFQAFEHTLQTHNHTHITRAEIAALIGKGLHEAYEALVPEGDVPKLALAHVAFQSENMQLITGYEALQKMLDDLQRQGLQIGAWSSREENLAASLRLAGILDYFSVIIGGGHVRRFKPDPEGLHIALERLTVSPEHAIMVGDAVHDINAGRAAHVGMTIAITHGFGAHHDLESVHPTHIVHRLSDIPPLIASA